MTDAWAPGSRAQAMAQMANAIHYCETPELGRLNLLLFNFGTISCKLAG
jgi:hypothetical protein